MTDVTQMSDADLMALVNQQSAPQDLTQMSDDDLLKMAGLPPKAPSFGSQLERGAGLATRALVQGAVGLPGTFLDFGHSLYDLATSPEARSATWEQMKHPSQWLTRPSDAPTAEFDRALDPYLPTPKTKGERIASVLLSMEGGAVTPQVPVPGAGSVPSNFRTPAQVKRVLDAQIQRNSQDKGYVVPPSTTNPSLPNLGLETVAGKINTQNAASAINQKVRNAAAATDLGLNPELLTPEAVAAVKSEAGKGFEAARTIPQVKTDQQYSDALDAVLKETHGANASFPGAANPDIEKLVNIYRQPNFTGDAAVSAVKMLRAKASDAYRTGDSEAGMAYKGIAGAIESQLERGAQQAGGPYENLVAALRKARKTYAQASTVEDAMDPTGNVSGQKLAAAWNRNEPLSGDLLAAAKHAATFPKANGPVNSSNVQHLNMVGPLAGAVAGHELTHSPWGYLGGAVLPMARMSSKAYLLSRMGQRGAIPSSEVDRAFPSWSFGAVTGATNP